MDNKPLYEKYEVRRTDGTPVGRTFVIEIDKDPDASQALVALSQVYVSSRPQLALSLFRAALDLIPYPDEASDSQPASTVSDAAIVAQVRLVMELEKECENDCCFEAAHAAAKAQLDAMLKASEVTA